MTSAFYPYAGHAVFTLPPQESLRCAAWRQGRKVTSPIYNARTATIGYKLRKVISIQGVTSSIGHFRLHKLVRLWQPGRTCHISAQLHVPPCLSSYRRRPASASYTYSLLHDLSGSPQTRVTTYTSAHVASPTPLVYRSGGNPIYSQNLTHRLEPELDSWCWSHMYYYVYYFWSAARTCYPSWITRSLLD